MSKLPLFVSIPLAIIVCIIALILALFVNPYSAGKLIETLEKKGLW